MGFIRFEVFMVLSLKCFSHFGHFFVCRRKTSALSDASQQYFCSGDAALSVLEVCTLMGFIDLNNIRGCGDVIKAEITSV